MCLGVRNLGLQLLFVALSCPLSASLPPSADGSNVFSDVAELVFGF